MQAVSVPDYQLIVKCGRGSFGDVYVARSLSGSLVALKVIEKNNYSVKEFNGLKYYCSRCVDSPFLIKIFHTGETESFFYYTMELADNFGDDDNYIPETLANRLINEKRLSPHAVRELALSMLSGLKILHSAGLVHRDIKPENIIFVNNVPKLSDIGLVSAVSATFSVGGTLGFIPPEKLTSSSGSKTETDDLYALGKLIYCVFSGNSPDKFPSLPCEIELDDETRRLNEVVMVACNTDSLLRFHSIDKFSKALMTSVSRKRRVVNLIWRHRHIWEVVILVLSLSLFLLLNPLTVNYGEIASRIITMQKPPVIINPVNKLHNISGEQFLVLSGRSSYEDSGQGGRVPDANIIRNIELPPVISDSEFEKLMKRQLDIPSLTACTLYIEYYLIEQGSKRFPELRKEYSAYLASLAGIQNLMFKYLPDMVAEIKILIKNCPNPLNVPQVLVPLLTPEMWKDKNMYMFYCDCAIRSEAIKVIMIENRNNLPEAVEWTRFSLATRQRHAEQPHTIQYTNPSGGASSDFENVLAHYHNVLKTDKNEYYSLRAVRFLEILNSHITTPAITALENSPYPLELELAMAKEISLFAQQNIDNYVIFKYNIPESFFQEKHGKQNAIKIKKRVLREIAELPAVEQQRKWRENRQVRLELLREKELENISNPYVAAYLKAKRVLNPYLTSKENN